jgi:hypothetical protein
MNKIFQIGFNKCATTSLNYLFDQYTSPQIKSIHWDYGNLARKIFANHLSQMPLLTGYEDYTFFSDMEAFYKKGDKLEWVFIPEILFKELDKQYSNSKFILNIRDVNSWVDSRLRHYSTLSGKYDINYTDDSKRWYVEEHMKCFNLTKEQVIQKWHDGYVNHTDNVINYFKDKDNLLVYDIDHDNINKIKEFFNGEISFNVDKLPRKHVDGVWDV